MAADASPFHIMLELMDNFKRIVSDLNVMKTDMVSMKHHVSGSTEYIVKLGRTITKKSVIR